MSLTELSGETSEGAQTVWEWLRFSFAVKRIQTTRKRGKERARESQQMVDLARPPPRRYCRSPSGRSADPRSISHMSQSGPSCRDGGGSIGRSSAPWARTHQHPTEPQRRLLEPKKKKKMRRLVNYRSNNSTTEGIWWKRNHYHQWRGRKRWSSSWWR